MSLPSRDTRQIQIELNRWAAEDHADLGGRGLLFIPSVFIWPRLALSLDPPWPPALIYPARGVSALWEQPGRTGSGTALHRLLGTSRDRIGAYASSEIHGSREAYAEQAQRYQSTGWHAYKIHPPQR